MLHCAAAGLHLLALSARYRVPSLQEIPNQLARTDNSKSVITGGKAQVEKLKVY